MKVNILSEYLFSLNDDESLLIAVLFFSNRVFPRGSKFVMNIGFSTIIQVLSEIASLDSNEIQKVYLQYGDMGALSEYAVSKKNMVSLFQQQPLTLLSIYDRLKEIADTIGSGSSKDKKKILKGILIDSSPLEAKYLIKIINGETRIGLTEGLVEIAISKVFRQDLKQVRDAMLVLGDNSQIVLLAKRNLLHTALIKPLTPMSYMLADVMFTAEEIIDYYQKPLICEFKYDGIRAQMHKSGQQIRLFSRKLSDVTNAFPELVNAAADVRLSSQPLQALSDIDFIIDGEVMAFQNGRPLHFQELQRRLHKKNLTERTIAEIPLVYVAYDIMYFNGESLIRKSIKERKEILSNISFKEPIIISIYKLVSSEEEVIAMFENSKDSGHEGLVLKDPQSHYHPGKRGRYWVKLKKELDTIDAVIVVAEYGHGKRAGVLSDYTFAVRQNDDANSELRTIGKAYSGLTDREILQITKRLKSIIIKDEGVRIIVKPEIVLEVAFDSIQKSSRHDSGFALRFPRIKNIREDKNVSDIDSLQKLEQIYEKQIHIISRRERSSEHSI
jgi:DNA ligase 1